MTALELVPMPPKSILAGTGGGSFAFSRCLGFLAGRSAIKVKKDVTSSQHFLELLNLFFLAPVWATEWTQAVPNKKHIVTGQSPLFRVTKSTAMANRLGSHIGKASAKKAVIIHGFTRVSQRDCKDSNNCSHERQSEQTGPNSQPLGTGR